MLQEIGSRGLVAILLGRPVAPPPTAAPDPSAGHEPGNTLLAAQDAVLVSQLEVDPGSPVGLSAVGVDATNLAEENRIPLRSQRRGTVVPRVEAGGRDLERLAHRLDREVGLLRLNEPERL